MSYTVEQLAMLVNGKVKGDASVLISGVNTLSQAGVNEVSFLTTLKYKKELKNTSASAVILQEKYVTDSPVTCIIVENPHAAFALITQALYPTEFKYTGVHDKVELGVNCEISTSVSIGAYCYVGSNVTINDDCYISPGCVIADNVSIGRNTRIMPNVTIMNDSVIGDNVLIHAGAVIGSDGFGQANNDGVWLKVPQIGKVVIENDVEIGANTTIDRGAISDTVIKSGVKLDNLIHIAHNVEVGNNSLMAACTGIAGSTVIGKNCIFGGSVGVSGHLDITDNVVLTGRSTALQSIKEAGVYSSGTPLEENSNWHKNYLRFKQLDEMSKRLRHVEKKLEELKGKDIE